ncbi:MAG: hypothetical protein IPP15_07825 [Saprospiraceae bacterium]|uniref:Uncharacterized protein n=1 Tax=Candidatus Opimibacter skivensis TaxID=2982028 RepID=A0A9D7SUD6_9BACT|nr:hypothetical protein [Candidatus Opimibacter skivensis]
MLEAIRTYFFERAKKKRLKASSGTPVAFHLDRKNHYGLLTDATSADDRTIVNSFAEDLRKKGNRVKILGFFNGKMETISTPFDIITTNDLNKVSQVPKTEMAEDFMSQAFDVLINLSIKENHRPLDFISSVSKASFRIGPWYAQQQTNPYDLCIDAGNSATLKEWISELMHTLQKIY